MSEHKDTGFAPDSTSITEQTNPQTAGIDARSLDEMLTRCWRRKARP